MALSPQARRLRLALRDDHFLHEAVLDDAHQSLFKHLRGYRPRDFLHDLRAGVNVALLDFPQGMAYALLAGLPPQVGLYASILPLFVYGLLGSSRVLAVGPVAIVSLLVASGITPLANGDMALYVSLAITLAFLVGIIQIGMGLFRVGFLYRNTRRERCQAKRRGHPGVTLYLAFCAWI